MSAVGLILILLTIAQVLLPRVATQRIRDRVGRYGQVEGASVTAWPAVELLWGRAESASVRVESMRISPAQTAQLLWEARGIEDMDMSASRVQEGPLALHDMSFRKRGNVLYGEARFAEPDVKAALPTGYGMRLLGGKGNEVEVRLSGGLFGAGTSVEAVVRAQKGVLIAQLQGASFAGLTKITLFSDHHITVVGVGVSVEKRQPLTYRLRMRASLR